MVGLLLFDGRKDEAVLIKDIIKDTVAHISEDYWKIELVERPESVLDIVKLHPILDFIIYDVTEKRNVKLLETIRSDYKESLLLLIADSRISPIQYLKPGIRPDSLLLRPLDKANTEQTIYELIKGFQEVIDNKKDDRFFTLNDLDGSTRIPYKDIYYFDAKEKKIFVRTKSEEYSAYLTLEQLNKELPEEFVRCHRSFIINTKKLEAVFLSKNFVILKEDFEIPLSRSYKPLLKKIKRKTD